MIKKAIYPPFEKNRKCLFLFSKYVFSIFCTMKNGICYNYSILFISKLFIENKQTHSELLIVNFFHYIGYIDRISIHMNITDTYLKNTDMTVQFTEN